MALRSLATPNAIIHLPELSQSTPERHCASGKVEDLLPDTNANTTPPPLIFHITGNPGLIGYYQDFLALLAQPSGSATAENTECHSPTNFDDQNRENDEHNDDVNSDTANDGQPPKSHSVKMISSDTCVIAGFSLGGFEIVPLPVSASSSPFPSPASEEEKEEEQNEATQFMFPPNSRFSHLSGSSSSTARGEPTTIFTLKDQVELCYARLEHLVLRMWKHYCPEVYQQIIGLEDTGGDDDDGDNTTNDREDGRKREESDVEFQPIEVILTSHSVGGYIALEMVRLHHERYHATCQAAADESDNGNTSVDTDPVSTSTSSSQTSGPTSNDVIQGRQRRRRKEQSFRILSTILLTPTIIDIAKSTSGKLATPLLTSRYLSRTAIPSYLQTFSSVLSSVLPIRTLQYAVHKCTGMALESIGLRTTVSFLTNGKSVRQALQMAGDEMLEIGDGTHWEGEAWGIFDLDRDLDRDLEHEHDQRASPSRNKSRQRPRRKYNPPNMYFLFAKNDHWIADVTREQIVDLVRRRRRQQQQQQKQNTFNKLTVTQNGSIDGMMMMMMRGEGEKRHGVDNEHDHDHDDKNKNRHDRSRAKVIIDEQTGLVHGWCLTQSEYVARMTRTWVEESLAL